MVELSRLGDGSLRVSYGGDTLNTAVYLSRMGVDVGYVTALGDDPYSDDMVSKWQEEGVDTRFTIGAKGRMAGLYAIRTDERGERSFQYWRDHAPARDLFRFPEFSASSEAREALCEIDFLFLSGTTLSLFSQDDRAQLFDLLDVQRERGGTPAKASPISTPLSVPASISSFIAPRCVLTSAASHIPVPDEG